MKGMIVASFVSFVAFVAMTVGFRTIRGPARRLINIVVYFICVAVLLTVLSVTPKDLGFLPDDLIEREAWLDTIVALFVMSASFLGGWLQLFTLTNRGYSLRVLIDIFNSPQRALSPEELLVSYSDGRGLISMYDTRIKGLLDAGMLTFDGKLTSLTGRGKKAARLFRFLRGLYNSGERYD
jgi:hypothetical protein